MRDILEKIMLGIFIGFSIIIVGIAILATYLP
jgi:hypothetical protein